MNSPKMKRVWISSELYDVLKSDFEKCKKKVNGKRKRRYRFVDYTRDLAKGNKTVRNKGLNLKMRPTQR